MKINIIHSQHSNSVMNDAETLDYIFKRQKDKTEISHINVNNYTCPNATINIFIETINYSFVRNASYNIFIPNQHYFSQEMMPMLEGINKIFCKTKYCYETFKTFVSEDKLLYTGWRSTDISPHQIDKNLEDWFVLYTDHNYQDVQKIIDIWKLEYPTLNIVFSGVPRVGLKKRNLANIMYIDQIEPGKYENLFNSCMIHVILDTIDNYNHHLNQTMLSGSVPICINKGPMVELLYEDNFFGISCSKKSIPTFLGSKYKFSTDSLEETVKKVVGMSQNTLDLIGENNKIWANRRQHIFNEEIQKHIKELMLDVRNIKKREIKTYEDAELPTISLVSVYTSTPRFFKLPILNYRSHSYPRERLEWVIVSNNKEDQIEELLPPSTIRKQYRIKYVECDSDKTYGEMLNIGVENTSNDLIYVMEDDYFFYQNGLRMAVEEFLNLGKNIIGCTTIGTFDINNYISIISTNGQSFDHAKRIYLGTLLFKKEFWETGKFGSDVGNEMLPMLANRFKEYGEYSWDNKFVGIIYSGNTCKWTLPENQEPNGCHYRFSKNVYEFIVGLDTKPEIKEI